MGNKAMEQDTPVTSRLQSKVVGGVLLIYSFSETGALRVLKSERTIS